MADGLPGLENFMTDLCHVQSARASGEVSRICAELCSDTTVIPRGTKRDIAVVFTRTNWILWKT